MNKKISYLFVALAGICWGTIGIFLTTLGDKGFTQVQLAVYRTGVAAIIVALIALIKDRKLFKIRFRDFWIFIGTGLVSTLMLNLCYFYSIKHTSLSVAAVLLYTSPVFIMLLSALLFKEKLTVRKLAALPITILGCLCVTGLLDGGGATVSAKGIVVGICSGLAYALYSIFGRFALDRGYHPITVSLYTLILAALGGLPFSDINETFVLIDGASTVVFIALFGFICSALPFLFYTKGLEGIENSKAAIIATVEPVTATVVGVGIYNEEMTFFKAVGILLIFVSITVINVSFSKKISRGEGTR